MDTTIQRYNQNEFAVAPLGNLSSYLHWVNQIPMLTKEEEESLSTDWHETKNAKAARRLTMSHLRFVVRIARGYSGYGLSQEDLIQEGNIGLMKAVHRFDPRVGVRLASFAIHWIRAEMHEFVLRNWRIVKIATTKAQRKLFFNLRRASKKIGWLSRSEAKDIAEELNVTLADVQQMEQRLSNYDQSFDVLTNESDDESFTPSQYLINHAADAEDPAITVSHNDWQQQQLSALTQAIKSLDARSQYILKSRWLSDKKATLQTLAEKYGVSLERIRQIESAAMKKIRATLSEPQVA